MFPRRTHFYALVLLIFGIICIRAEVRVVSHPIQASTTSALDSSAPVMSGDGRYVLFLTANGGNGWVNLYLRDLQAGTTELISVAASGKPGAGSSGYATMSADARYIAFQSSAPDLVANDTNNVTDIFVRDRQAQLTILVSTAAVGTLGNGLSENPAITANGQFVVFESAANNLGPSDPDSARDIYVRDMQTGQITLASTGLAAIESVSCFDPSISNDGNRIAFVCAGHIYLRDRAGANTRQISTTTPSTPSNRDPFVSFDGSHVIFIASDVAGLKRYDVAAGTNYLQRSSGADGYRATPDARYAFDGTNRIDFASQTQTPALVDTAGVSTKVFVSSPSISDDGRRVFFLSNATNLVDGVTDGQYRWFVRDLVANTNGTFGANAPGSGLRLDFISNSSDGSRVAFDANSFGPAGDLNLAIDVFAFDFAGGLDIASSRTNVAQPNTVGRSFLNGIGADGTLVLFSSDAGSIVSADTNAVSDVFVYNVAAGTNRIVTLGTAGEPANGSSWRALISPDGRYVAFLSLATNLVSADSDGVEDVFITQLATGETRLITTAFGVSLRSFSDDGGRLLFERSVSPIGVFVYDWEKAAASVIPGASVANAVNGSSAISSDSGWIAYRNTLSAGPGGGIYLYDSAGAGPATRIAPLPPTSLTLLSFAPQSHWLLYGSNNVLFAQDATSTVATPLQTNVTSSAASAGATVIATVAPGTTAATQVYLVERATGNITLVSQAASVEGNASSDSPQISLDGSRILFRSKASNLVENDTNAIADYFVYDRSSSTIRRIAAASQKVILSQDGSFAAFQTIFDRVVAGDDNRTSDVFIETFPSAQEDITAHINITAGHLTLTWNTVVGGKYRIESASTLIQPAWTTFTADRIADRNHDEIAFDFAGQELYLRILRLP